MFSLSYQLRELDEFSLNIAWKLVGNLFQQTRTLIIGGLVYAILGLPAFFGTQSPWYLAATGLVSVICAGRVWLNQYYARARETASPAVWARRSVAGAWACGASWGLWNAAIIFEPDRTLLLGVMATLVSSIWGAAVRSCTVPIVAIGQIYLALAPMLLAYLLAGNAYMYFYAATTALHIMAALGLVRFLHAQTLRLLLQDEEKSKLVESLEIAKQDLEVVNTHLEGLAATDALTGIANRRVFDLVSEREWRHAAREDKPIAILLLDVDHFKKFNDFYGHQAGDQCLRDIASALLSTLRRGGDLVARYGGEEFVVVLPDSDLDGAAKVGEAIVCAIKALAIPHDASDFGHVTVSIGAASMVPKPNSMVSLLTEKADAALYVAKRSGRNQVSILGDVQKQTLYA